MRASESYPVRSYKTEKLKSENPASKKEEIEKREVCDTKASEQRTDICSRRNITAVI